MVMLLGMIVAGGAVATRATGEPGVAMTVLIVILVIVLPIIAFAAVAVCFAAFTTQIVVIEGAGYMGALQRNWTLLRGRFWALVFGAIGIALIVMALRFAVEGSVELALTAFVYTWMPASPL